MSRSRKGDEMDAKSRFIEAVKDQFGFSSFEANRIYDVYYRNKLVKVDSVNGSFELTDGRFWDKDVMQRAIDSNI
jgi:hypothetical protein